MHFTSEDADRVVDSALAANPGLMDRALSGSMDAFVELLECTGAKVTSFATHELV